MDIRIMPKRDNDKRIEAHLSPEEFKAFESIANEKQWSKKRLAENIIREFLKTKKKIK
jgi:hypothetical protein